MILLYFESVDDHNTGILDLLATISAWARAGDYADAARGLNQCIAHLQAGLSALVSDDQKKGVGDKIRFSLETMLLMLEHHNWVAIADVIDYEFVPLWKKAFP